MKIQPELSFIGSRGLDICTAEERACEEKAEWHVLWYRGKDGCHCMLLCPFHMELSKDIFVYLERHRFSATCDMPGVHWYGDHCSI